MHLVQFEPAALALLESPLPALELMAGANKRALVLAFARTGEERAHWQLQVPAALDAAGAVVFRIAWRPRVHPGASQAVVWKVDHGAVAAGESWDGAYATQSLAPSAARVIGLELSVATLAVPVGTLGWSPNDQVFGRLARAGDDPQDTLDDAATAEDDDALLYLFAIEIPTT